MSVHIGAKKGDIADAVLLPGDPLRAQFVAENFLENATQYNKVRGMLGFTGTYKGKRVSVQGTGMGIPSHLIYVHELMADFGAKKLIRIGSCGSLQSNIHTRELVFAMAASTDSNVNKLRFGGADFAPTADSALYRAACDLADQKGYTYHAGNILSTDQFYHDDPEHWKQWAAFNILAVEMEAAGLYTEAAKFGAQALTILTVSDSLVTNEELSSEDRQKSFTQMMEIALEIA
ncbi:MAG: purine-nucleoside phosphorylase [Spirochaetes bacterium]|jgi:purine-nucleoside phosphorylase|nr:purine-nucleoside phosphorylase [Spirochaetota bacterium]